MLTIDPSDSNEPAVPQDSRYTPMEIDCRGGSFASQGSLDDCFFHYLRTTIYWKEVNDVELETARLDCADNRMRFFL